MPVSPKIIAFFKRFSRPEVSTPNNQDELGAYPLRMQISAIPERRYLRTVRLLAVLSFINLGVLIALACGYVYLAARQDIAVRTGWDMYTMDPMRKVIRRAEPPARTVSGMELMMEKAVRDYITARNSAAVDSIQQRNLINATTKYLASDDDFKAYNKENSVLQGQTRGRGLDRRVYIYYANRTPSGLWEVLFDVFDMPPLDPFNPICNCHDAGRACLECQLKNNRGHHRFKGYVQTVLGGAPNAENPLGIKMIDYALIPRLIHPNEGYWDTPSILKPEL